MRTYSRINRIVITLTNHYVENHPFTFDNATEPSEKYALNVILQPKLMDINPKEKNEADFNSKLFDGGTMLSSHALSPNVLHNKLTIIVK